MSKEVGFKGTALVFFFLVFEVGLFEVVFLKRDLLENPNLLIL